MSRHDRGRSKPLSTSFRQIIRNLLTKILTKKCVYCAMLFFLINLMCSTLRTNLLLRIIIVTLYGASWLLIFVNVWMLPTNMAPN